MEFWNDFPFPHHCFVSCCKLYWFRPIAIVCATSLLAHQDPCSFLEYCSQLWLPCGRIACSAATHSYKLCSDCWSWQKCWQEIVTTWVCFVATAHVLVSASDFEQLGKFSRKTWNEAAEAETRWEQLQRGSLCK